GAEAVASKLARRLSLSLPWHGWGPETPCETPLMPPVITMMARDSLHTVLTAATPKSVATAGVLETQLPTCTKRCAWIMACTGLLTPLPLLQRMRPTCARSQISRPQPVLKEAGPTLDRLILQTHRSSWVPMRCPH